MTALRYYTAPQLDINDIYAIAETQWVGISPQTRLEIIAPDSHFVQFGHDENGRKVVTDAVGLWQVRTLSGNLYNVGYHSPRNTLYISRDRSGSESESVLTLD